MVTLDAVHRFHSAESHRRKASRSRFPAYTVFAALRLVTLMEKVRVAKSERFTNIHSLPVVSDSEKLRL